MTVIRITMEELQNILSDIKVDMFFDDLEQQIANGAVVHLLVNKDDQNPTNVITSVDEFKKIRKI